MAMDEGSTEIGVGSSEDVGEQDVKGDKCCSSLRSWALVSP